MPHVPTQEQIDDLKAKHGVVALVSSPEGDECIIRKLTPVQYGRFKASAMDADKRQFVDDNVCADALAFPAVGSPEFKDLFERLPAFKGILSGEILTLSGASAGAGARKL